jgi:hypothetical protein
MEFLKRNPTASEALQSLARCHAAAQNLYQRVGPPEAAPDDWSDFDVDFKSVRNLALGLLINDFGFVDGPWVPDPLYGVPAYLTLLPGPSDFHIYADLWRGIWRYAFPDFSLGRRIEGGGAALNATIPEVARVGLEAFVMAHPSTEARMVLKSIECLAVKYSPECSWSKLPERAQREVRGSVVRLRQELSLPETRQRPDSYYAKLLAVWDRREGWTGHGYDQTQESSLSRARRESRATKDVYYRAFELIAGERYSANAWKVDFGGRIQNAPKYWMQRRNAGRPQGQKKRAVKTPRPLSIDLPLKDTAATISADPAQAIEDMAVMRLNALLQDGVSVKLAVAQVDELPDKLRTELLDPANAHAIKAYQNKYSSLDS